jgi:hypothetical protein
VNGIDRRYRPYAYFGNVVPNASPAAAVATAAHRVLVRQFTLLIPYGCPSQRNLFDGVLKSSLARIPDGPAKDAGLAVGQRAADAILAMRAADGWNQQLLQDFNYPQGTSPGEYRFTPPFDFVLLRDWGNMQPFVLYRAAQYRPGPPYPVNSSQYTQDYNEIKRLGGDGVTTPSQRTPDETEIARFWYESSPQGWNRIARRVSVVRGPGLWETARLFALLNLASADGYIANFESKFHYNYWRPITAIRLGDADGNPGTVGDPGWTPLLDTPPVPDYASGHSVQGGAAAEILKLFFGTDDISFRTCSLTMLPGRNCGEASEKLRSFSSFTQAAEENALSRILVGIHFRKACMEGVRHGRKIAQHTFTLHLLPLR